MSNFKDYMGLPDDSVQSIGNIYPINILEWEKFSTLAHRYLMFNNEFLKNKLKITDKNIKIFDYLMFVVLSEKDESKYASMVKELEQLFSMALKKEVQCFVKEKSKSIVFKISGTDKEINRDNYEDFRSVVFRQNLLFEPIFAPNERSQKIIDKAIRTLGKSGAPVDLEAMLVYVSNAKKIHPSELQDYTFFQLRADCEMEMRKEINRDINLFRSQGADVKSVNLLEELGIRRNPYGKDVLFKKISRDGDNKLEKMMKV